MNNRPNLILIVCDELTGLKYLDNELLETLTGIQKFKKRCLYFNNHYTNSVPCSVARSILYTGKNTNHTQVTDNVQTSIPWQKSMKTVDQGLKTLGSYFIDSNPKYVGKIHLLQELDPNNYTRYKPRLSTEHFLSDYDFPSYTKMGDYAYDSRMAYFNDPMVTEQILPTGTNKNKCDYYDSINNICLDGAIPYMKNKISNKEHIVLCCNYDNPHDILYSNIKTSVPNLLSVTGQISGSKYINHKNNCINTSNTSNTVSDYNDNYTKYSNLEIFNKKSLELDNCTGSLTNKDKLNIGILIQILSKYYYYGIDYFDSKEYQEYQTAYYRCLKQVDEEISKLYDFIESNGLFSNSIVCLTSDHGDYVCAHGLIQKASPIYNPGSNVPLFISYPNMPEQYINLKSQIITSHINLLPTLLSLSGFTQSSIKMLGLSKPFIGSDGKIIDSDYNVVFLFLSMTFGPLLIYTANNIENVNAQIDLKKNNLDNYNILTIQGFSVCSKFILDSNYMNCGYYFSLLHVYIETIKYYSKINNNSLLNNIGNCFNSDSDLDSNSCPIYILQDKSNSVPFAFINCSKSKLHLKIYTDPIVIDYFKNPIIIKYDHTKSIYNKFLYKEPIYNTDVVGINLFSIDSIFFEPEITKNIPLESLHVIISQSKNSNIIYIGTCTKLDIILSNDPIINKIILNPIIVKISDIDLDKFPNYILHPIIQSVYICFNKLDPTNPIDMYNDFNTINCILTRITLYYNYNTLNEIIVKSKNSCVNNLIYKSIQMYNNEKKLRLPGLGFDICKLISNNYQVQLFNNTHDFEEIINLVDSSRIKQTNPILISKSYQKLYENVLSNELETIYISLPIELIFDSIDFIGSGITN